MRKNKVFTVIIVFIFLIAAAFLAAGIYITSCSLNYIRTYMEISTISPDNAFRYILESSASYFGFAVLIFSSGLILVRLTENHNTNKENYADDPNYDKEDRQPENNPYYTAQNQGAVSEQNQKPETHDVSEVPSKISSEMIKEIFNSK